jgi:hypothetical protein
MDTKKSPLRDLNDTDAYNFDLALRFFGTVTMLPEDVANLYLIHQDALSKAHLVESAQYAGGLYAACRKHLLLGTVALFRLYSAQMFRETRAAVEAAGLARAIQTDPENLRIFKANDGRNSAARKEARSTFTSSTLFPDTIPTFKSLKVFYADASELSHSTFLTFVRHLGETDQPGQFRFSCQDLVDKERVPRDLPTFLFWLCLAHIAILTAADAVFAEVPADFEFFKSERNVVFERVRRFDAQHKAAFPPEVES